MTAPLSFADLDSCLTQADTGGALSVEQVRSAINRCITPVRGIERVALRSALGRVLGRALTSPIDVPSHDNSAMDGYALRAADLAADGETRLRIAGAALAGAPLDAPLAAGQAVRIMTGAMPPVGADTIVPQELVRADAGWLIVPPGQRTGQHLRRRGEDLRAGSEALPAGRRLTPADLGLLASLGVAEVPVRRRVRVAFFSTGDELRSIGEPLAPGQVYDSNRYTLW
ncbi:MAG: molybdopterin molybdotransferase MoeA, partial [Burkholderiaceae bacterium]